MHALIFFIFHFTTPEILSLHFILLLLTFLNDTMAGRIGQIFKFYSVLIIHFHGAMVD